ncbi:hypothetical protein ElyMa_003157000 [Elysia marginata]|uniref:Uncharacterized protein n=1 Tax=Elysia marginata TaxID=1093978 RepID=A0AAV4IUT9_9GAST|nr:hypothetical protein ElyMa_003157000 [Elysia marginata]
MLEPTRPRRTAIIVPGQKKRGRDGGRGLKTEVYMVGRWSFSSSSLPRAETTNFPENLPGRQLNFNTHLQCRSVWRGCWSRAGSEHIAWADACCCTANKTPSLSSTSSSLVHPAPLQTMDVNRNRVATPTSPSVDVMSFFLLSLHLSCFLSLNPKTRSWLVVSLDPG